MACRNYFIRKEEFLHDEEICKENRMLFKKFFEYEEYKLKRKNGLAELDEPSFKTLNCYIIKFGNVNKWFKNKPLKELTKADIKRVYDNLEEGVIKNRFGLPYKDRKSVTVHGVIRHIGGCTTRTRYM